MAENVTKLPIGTGKEERSPSVGGWHPLGTLQREIDRLFDDFGRGTWRWPMMRDRLEADPEWRSALSWGVAPAVDVAEKTEAYEISAELPGMDEKDIELTVSNGVLTITGEKSEEKEEKKTDYYVSERRYGTFRRTFGLPEGVDADQIEASFKNGVLTVSLPKKPEAKQPEKKISIKAA